MEQLLRQSLSLAFAEAIMSKVGFVEAPKTSINQKLSNIDPDGGTAMRDSVIRGQVLLLRLNEALMNFNAQNNWNFVHIVLTDGQDNSSKATLEQVCQLQLKIGMQIPVSRLKTYYVGVDIESNEQAIKEILVMTSTGMKNSEFIRIDNERQISGVFEKIQADLQIIQRTQFAAFASSQGAIITGQKKNIPVLSFKRVNYCVLFNLDISGSMSGKRWKQVTTAVKQFVGQLGENDYVALLVFNNNSQIIDIS